MRLWKKNNKRKRSFYLDREKKIIQKYIKQKQKNAIVLQLKIKVQQQKKICVQKMWGIVCSTSTIV